MTYTVSEGGTSLLVSVKINPRSFNGELVATAEVGVRFGSLSGLETSTLASAWASARGDEPCLRPSPNSLPCLLFSLSPPSSASSSPVTPQCPSPPEQGNGHQGFGSESQELQSIAFIRGSPRFGPPRKNTPQPYAMQRATKHHPSALPCLSCGLWPWHYMKNEALCSFNRRTQLCHTDQAPSNYSSWICKN